MDFLAPQPPIAISDGFEQFWEAWPKYRRVCKKQAKEQWMRLAPDLDLHFTILQAVERHKQHWRDTDTEARFILHPHRWLRDRRWEDELDQSQSGSDFAQRVLDFGRTNGVHS